MEFGKVQAVFWFTGFPGVWGFPGFRGASLTSLRLCVGYLGKGLHAEAQRALCPPSPAPLFMLYCRP
jgi:hypothetical protein